MRTREVGSVCEAMPGRDLICLNSPWEGSGWQGVVDPPRKRTEDCASEKKISFS